MYNALLNLMNPSVSGLFVNTRCDAATSVCVISKLPNTFTFRCVGMLPIVPTIQLIALSVSPFLISKS